MKVYTKQGDTGLTSLVGGERVFKTDERVEAYGTVDELGAFAAQLTDRLRADAGTEALVDDLVRIGSLLRHIEGLLAVGEGGADKVAPLDAAWIEWLEARIDAIQASLEPITRFTIPGGHPAVSACHVCRTVCRRAERAALRADQTHGVAPEVLACLNRLSDYFYVLGRTLTAFYGAEETQWIP